MPEGTIQAAERVLVVASAAVGDPICAILQGAGLVVHQHVEEPADAVAAAVRHRADLVILADPDISVVERFGVPVLAVSGDASMSTLTRARAAGVRGYLVAPFSSAQLIASVVLALGVADPNGRALRALSDVASVLEAAGVITPGSSREGVRLRWVPALSRLSKREREVLEELLAHLRPPQIAKRLHISPHTVRNHLKSIYAKIGVHSQAELLEHLIDRS